MFLAWPRVPGDRHLAVSFRVLATLKNLWVHFDALLEYRLARKTPANTMRCINARQNSAIATQACDLSDSGETPPLDLSYAL